MCYFGVGPCAPSVPPFLGSDNVAWVPLETVDWNTSVSAPHRCRIQNFLEVARPAPVVGSAGMMDDDEGQLSPRRAQDRAEDQDQDDDHDQDEEQREDEDGGAAEDDDGQGRAGASSVASSAPPDSPLLVPSEKDKQDQQAADGVDGKGGNAASVNSDMILEALEALEHKNLRGTSVDQILDFLLRTYPVSRDRSSLRTELSCCLEAAVEQGLVRLNQNGSYRLASFREQASDREHGPDGGGQSGGKDKDKEKGKGQGRARGRRKVPVRPEASDWRPSPSSPSSPSPSPSPERGRGRGRSGGRRRASSKQATRKSPRLHAGPDCPGPSTGTASAPAPPSPARPRRGRAAPSPAAAPNRPVKRRAAKTPARRQHPSGGRGSSRSSSRASSRASSRFRSQGPKPRQQPATKRRRRR